MIDGDTIEIHGQRIRFNGIDAPESAQQCDDAKGFRYPCGAKAAAALDGFLAAYGIHLNTVKVLVLMNKQ